MDGDAAHFVVLLHIFGPLATLNRDTDKSQWKWLCGHNHLKRYLGYICHHPTLFYCIDSILPAENRTDAKALKFMICCTLYCCRFCKTIFRFIMHCMNQATELYRIGNISFLSYLLYYFYCYIQCELKTMIVPPDSLHFLLTSDFTLSKKYVTIERRLKINAQCLWNFSSWWKRPEQRKFRNTAAKNVLWLNYIYWMQKSCKVLNQRVVSRSKIAKHGDNHLKRRTRIDMNCKYWSQCTVCHIICMKDFKYMFRRRTLIQAPT